MSLTIPLKVQGPGTWAGWSSVVGASEGWQAVDDSATTTHDSDTTYLVLARRVLPNGVISFPMFLQCDPGQPISMVLYVAAKIDSGTPELQIGFYRSGSTAFHATTFSPGASYSVATRTFSTNPITGSAWTATDFVGLEACVQMAPLTVARARITLISGTLTAAMPTNSMRRSDDRWVTS